MDLTRIDRVLADLDFWIAIAERPDTPMVRGSQTMDHGPWTMPGMKRVLLVGAVAGAGLLVGIGWLVLFLADVMDRAEVER